MRSRRTSAWAQRRWCWRPAGWWRSIPVVFALALWTSYGGSIYWPEIGAAFGGHRAERRPDDRGGGRHRIGHRASGDGGDPDAQRNRRHLDRELRVGACRVGSGSVLARYTPTAMVAQFQHGLVRLDVIVVAMVLVGPDLDSPASGCGWAFRSGGGYTSRSRSPAARWPSSRSARCCTRAGTCPRAGRTRSRRADERALAAIPGPLTIEVHLAPEDPRRSDLERRALSKLRRVRCRRRDPIRVGDVDRALRTDARGLR